MLLHPLSYLLGPTLCNPAIRSQELTFIHTLTQHTAHTTEVLQTHTRHTHIHTHTEDRTRTRDPRGATQEPGRQRGRDKTKNKKRHSSSILQARRPTAHTAHAQRNIRHGQDRGSAESNLESSHPRSPLVSVAESTAAFHALQTAWGPRVSSADTQLWRRRADGQDWGPDRA